MQATRHLDIESVDTSFIALGQKLLKIEKSCLALRKVSVEESVCG